MPPVFKCPPVGGFHCPGASSCHCRKTHRRDLFAKRTRNLVIGIVLPESGRAKNSNARTRKMEGPESPDKLQKNMDGKSEFIHPALWTFQVNGFPCGNYLFRFIHFEWAYIYKL